MNKIVLGLVFFVLSFSTNIISANTVSEKFESKESFLSYVVTTSTFEYYRESLKSLEPKIIRSFPDSDTETLYFISFELEHKHQKDLIFILDSSYNTHELMVEYSTSGSFTVYEVTDNKLVALDLQNQNINSDCVSLVAPNHIDFNCATWMCTQYYRGGGYYDTSCGLVLGGVCSVLKLSRFGTITCYLGQVLGCYVPSYSLCVEGEWLLVCQQ